MAKAAKETFWNSERIKRNWSLKYIAKKTGIPQSTLSAWFSGIKAPRNNHHIEQLCSLFNIPFDKGYNEFYQEERKWDSSKKTQHFYNTYWNDLREKNNLSLGEISEMTGISKVTISSNFSGRYIPNRSSIEKYCKLFEIPFEEGKAEFKKAHAQFLAIQNRESTTSEPMETEYTSAPDTKLDYTFWPSLFANARFSTEDLAKYLGIEEYKVQEYFTGKSIPNPIQLKMLCGLYGGVDISEGKEAFELLHKNYTHFTVTDTSESLTIKPSESVESENAVTILMESFYEEVSYSKFIHIQTFLNNLDKNSLDAVYRVYKEISNIINS